MKSCYLVTGASGHLGSTLLRQLAPGGAEVRGLSWPELPASPVPGVSYYAGDLRDPGSLRPFFEGLEGRELFLIHTAGLIDLSPGQQERLRAVNVEGTRSLLALSREYGVRRFLYVSSVHAIPEGVPGQVITETDRFSPSLVVGDYAGSKAEATGAVLEAGKQGLPVLVVHPSGILGPGDFGDNHLVRLLEAYLNGSVRFDVRGGYDFVDVRDVARGCLLALEKGTPGSCYLLTGQRYEIRELLNMVRSVRNRPRPVAVPLWTARAAAPLVAALARRRGLHPLYTPYSLYTLRSPDRFSHDKATAELGYRPRDLRYTVRDTVLQLLDGKAPENPDFYF